MELNMNSKNFLNAMSTEEFLKDYWLKKPLLIKNAVPDINTFAQRDDFFSMALDEDFETRIVLEKGGEYPWQVKHGPLDEEDFSQNALWTLMCHNLNLYDPSFYELQQLVRFIPDWQFDDVMATISNKGASVGAHIDNYSVFIIQAQGKRKWMLQTSPDTAFQPDIDIKLLKEFNPNIEWELNPGDAIYIPPHCAHHGISLEDSISYSVGFKSIEYNKVVDFWATQVFSELTDDDFYRDPGLELREDCFAINPDEFENIYEDVVKKMDQRSLKFALARLLSRPRRPIEPTDFMSWDEIAKAMSNGMELRKDQFTKFNSFNENGQLNMFINGHHFDVSTNEYEQLKTMLDVPPWQALQLPNDLTDNIKEIIEVMQERAELYLEYPED
jgi:50S ribosomal protein L16 3-hydroxylase